MLDSKYWHNPDKSSDLELLFLIILAYYSCALIFDFFSFTSPINWQEIYFLVLILVSLGLAFFISKSINYSSFRLSFRRENSLIIIAFIAIFFFRLSNLTKVSIWYDEAAQILDAIGDLPVRGCASSSQPPLDCVLGFFGQTVFKLNEFGIRFHAALMSCAATVLFYYCCRMISQSYISALLLSLIYLTNRDVQQYAWEARPVSLSLFHGILFYYTTIKYLLRDSNEIRHKILVGLSYLLLLLSIGLQPIAIGGSLCLVGLISIFIGQGDASRLRWLVFIISFVLFLFLPILHFDIEFRKEAFIRTPMIFVGHFIESIQQFFLRDLTNQCQNYIWLFTFVPIVGIYHWIRRKTMAVNSKKIFALIFLAFFTYFIFILLFPSIFRAYFDGYLFNNRYAVIGWPLGLFVICLSMKYLHSINIRLKILTNLVLAYSLSVNPLGLNLNFDDLERQNLRKIYSWLEQNSSENDFITMGCFPLSNEVCISRETGLVAAPIYYHQQTQNGKLFKKPLTVSLFKKFFYNEPIDQLFLIIEYRKNSLSYLPIGENIISLDGIKHKLIGPSVIYIFDGGISKIKKSWFAFIDEISKKVPENNVGILESRLQMALLNKDQKLYLYYRDLYVRSSNNSNYNVIGLPDYDIIAKKIWSDVFQ